MSIKCHLLNVRSIKNKLPELHGLIYSVAQPCIFFTTESWLSNEFPSSLLDPQQQYTIMRCDRQVRSAGGVCVFISRDIRSHRVTLSTNLDILLRDSGVELVCFELFMSRVKYRFITLYRPPNLTKLQAVILSNILSELTDPNITCIIPG